MQPKLTIGILLLSLAVLLACLGPSLSQYNPYSINLTQKNHPPSKQHWFGTDELGRDLFTRCCFGARISLTISFLAAIVDLLIGVIWGSTAAYFGGKVDEYMMRLADILYAFPYLLTVLVIMVALDTGILSIIVAMTFIGWITMARIVRGTVLQIKQQEYVQAAKLLGTPPLGILCKHIIPNCLGAIIVTTTLTIPSAIFTEAFLSFLGLGVQAPQASWGVMTYEGLPALSYYPWRLLFPACFISVTILSFNLIADTLRSSLDSQQTKLS